MADIISLQELADAKLDAQSLEQFINGGVDEDVLTRLSQQYPTIKKLLLEFQKYNGRAYKTYAEMDADKANLSSKTKVTVTNDTTASNNGDWQWDGVAFTKSAFDPVEMSKTYTRSRLSKENFAKYLANLSDQARLVYSDNHQSTLINSNATNLVKTSTVSSDTSLVTSGNTKLTNITLKNTGSQIGSLNIKNTVADVLSINLMPLDSLNNNVLTTFFQDLDTQVLKNVAQDSILVRTDANGFRVVFPINFTDFNVSISEPVIFDMSKVFTAVSINDISAFEGLAIASHIDGAIQFKVSTTTLVALGYGENEQDALAFIMSCINTMYLKIKRKTSIKKLYSLFANLVLPTDTYTLTYSSADVTLTANLMQIVDNTKEIAKIKQSILTSVNANTQAQTHQDFSVSDLLLSDASEIISASGEIILSKNKVISNISASATTKSRFISLVNSAGKTFKLPVLATDTYSGDKVSTTWVDFNPKLSDIISTSVTNDANGYRVKLKISNYNGVASSVSTSSVFDESGFFKSLSQTLMSTSDALAVSSEADNSMQFKITKSALSAGGFLDTQDEAKRYVYEIFESLKLKVRTSTSKQFINSMYKLLLPADTYTLSVDDGITASLTLSDIASATKPTAYTKNSFSTLSTSAKNISGWAITNGIVALKVNFEYGQVFSDDQLAVIDLDKNQYKAQFAPEYSPNFGYNTTDGYWGDGSYKTGTLFILDTLAVNAAKTYQVRIYQSAISAKSEVISDSENANTRNVTYSGITLNFNKTGPYILPSISDSGVEFVINHGVRVAPLSTDGLSTPTSFMSKDKKINLIRKGDVFIDVEVELFNSAVQTLASDSLRVYLIYRLFKNGVLKIYSYTSVLKDIPINVLHGIQNSWADAESKVTEVSVDYLAAKLEKSSRTAFFKANYLYGDVHRDGVNFGAERPPLSLMGGSIGSTWDMRFGWSDPLNSASSLKWKTEKGHSWGCELDFIFKNTFTDFRHLTDALNNEPTGFLANGLVSKFEQMQTMLDGIQKYNLSNMRYWHKEVVTTDADYRLYSTMLMKDYVLQEDNFEAIFNGFINIMRMRWGTDYAVNYGNAYLATQATGRYFMMQFESRIALPHIQWLWFHAVKIGDTVKANALKAIMAEIAPKLADRALAYGGISLSPVTLPNDKGNSNGTASGMRYLALAIRMGLDTDGRMREAFDLCEDHLIAGDWWMSCNNQLNDNINVRACTNRYLHYSAYAEHMYAHACLLLNITPNHDIAQFMLNGFTSSGEAKEIEYCVSESRRGIRNTYSFAINALALNNTLASVNAAKTVADYLLKNGGFDDAGRPSRLGDYYYSLDPSKNTNYVTIGNDLVFTTTMLTDLWFAHKFSII